MTPYKFPKGSWEVKTRNRTSHPDCFTGLAVFNLKAFVPTVHDHATAIIANVEDEAQIAAILAFLNSDFQKVSE